MVVLSVPASIRHFVVSVSTFGCFQGPGYVHVLGTLVSFVHVSLVLQVTLAVVGNLAWVEQLGVQDREMYVLVVMMTAMIVDDSSLSYLVRSADVVPSSPCLALYSLM